MTIYEVHLGGGHTTPVVAHGHLQPPVVTLPPPGIVAFKGIREGR